MDAASCRAQLARLLAEECALLATLQQQLQHEHHCLTINDVESLDAAGGARQQTLARLLGIEDERAQLCRRAGRGIDRAGLAGLLVWCDPAGTLAVPQRQCAELAGQCRAQNERNGALVTARLTRVSGMLDMLSDGTPRTYGARPGRFDAPSAGRMVSVSA